MGWQWHYGQFVDSWGYQKSLCPKFKPRWCAISLHPLYDGKSTMGALVGVLCWWSADRHVPEEVLLAGKEGGSASLYSIHEGRSEFSLLSENGCLCTWGWPTLKRQQLHRTPSAHWWQEFVHAVQEHHCHLLPRGLSRTPNRAEDLRVAWMILLISYMLHGFLVVFSWLRE